MASAFIAAEIAAAKVVVFSKTYCPYCTKAKRALESVGLPASAFVVHELDKMSDGETDSGKLQPNRMIFTNRRAEGSWAD